MRKLILIMAAALFIGCRPVQLNQKPTLYSVAGNAIDEICLNGVKYYYVANRGMTAAYGTDSKVILCK